MRHTPLSLAVATLVGASLVGALSFGSVSALAATPPTSTLGTVGLWAADWGGAAGSRTGAGWEAAAENDSLLIGQPGVYAKWMPQLRAWNPNLTILAYNLGPYLEKGSSDFTTVLAQDPSWFAHDASGNLINLKGFPGNYLMEMSNAGYRAWHAQELAATVAEDGFDGAMDDSIGPAPLGKNYASGIPIDPATGQAYTDTEYLANSVLMLDADKAALGSKYLAFNGLINGPTYVQDSDILATSTANAGVSELFLRSPTSPVTEYPTATTVQDSLQMMASMAASGKAFLGWTKVWSSGTATQIAQWEQFDLGVYLIGQQRGSYLDFMPSKSADNTGCSYNNLKDELGAPLGAYQMSGSVYTRSFEDGSVTINTSTDTATIDVAGRIPPPTVAASAATSITGTGGTINGSVNPNGFSTTWGAQIIENGTLNWQYVAEGVPAGSGTSAVNEDVVLTGLQPSSTYYFQFFAYSTTTVYYSSILFFNTQGTPPPTITASAATSITGTGATINGSVNPNGLSTTWGAQIIENGTLNWQYVAEGVPAGSGTSAVNEDVVLTGLQPSSTYYFQFFAYSTTTVYYSSILSFKTQG
jgi:hypothetical protein